MSNMPLKQGTRMGKNEKLDRACKDFSKLNEEQQDYILGIMQALVFAKTSTNKKEQEKSNRK